MTALTERPLILINSGAYAEPELSAEFGSLPPAFLPVGLGRLYELQARMLAPLRGEVVLTLPESFDLSDWDAERLAVRELRIVRTPDELSLGAALLYALGRLGFRDRPLRILHGDTLVDDIDLSEDNLLAAADGADGYRWGHVLLSPAGLVQAVQRPSPSDAAGPGQRLCGYFAFASAARFAEKLALAGGDFYDALNRQTAETPLRAATPERWLDFGHVQTFFRSRHVVTTERAFNSLQIGAMHVRKRSVSAAPKLRAEARWLRAVPPGVAPFCARVLADGEDTAGYFYDTEYEYMPTLAELYAFGRVSAPSWSRILGSCAGFIEAARDAGQQASTAGTLQQLVVDKTAARLEQLACATGLDLHAANTLNGRPAPSLWQCLRDIEATLAGCGDMPAIMHGDFCFSNILYSFRTDRIRLIDPRGLTGDGGFSLYGDQRYDLAKLMHSVCGRYDLILAGRYLGGQVGPQAYTLDFRPEPWRQQIEALASSTTMGGIPLGSSVVWAAMTSLFLSMPPLHADRPDRQGAFIANALRLHAEIGATR